VNHREAWIVYCGMRRGQQLDTAKERKQTRGTSMNEIVAEEYVLILFD
jgi:hypothetical protein